MENNSELKTLKDLEAKKNILVGLSDFGDMQTITRNVVYSETLRQEAIKYIREPCPEPDYGEKYCRTCRAINSFIQHFFNITDEDLK